MARMMNIEELVKEFQVEKDTLVGLFKSIGITVKTTQKNVSEENVDKLRAHQKTKAAAVNSTIIIRRKKDTVAVKEEIEEPKEKPAQKVTLDEKIEKDLQEEALKNQKIEEERLAAEAARQADEEERQAVEAARQAATMEQKTAQVVVEDESQKEEKLAETEAPVAEKEKVSKKGTAPNNSSPAIRVISRPSADARPKIIPVSAQARTGERPAIQPNDRNARPSQAPYNRDRNTSNTGSPASPVNTGEKRDFQRPRKPVGATTEAPAGAFPPKENSAKDRNKKKRVVDFKNERENERDFSKSPRKNKKFRKEKNIPASTTQPIKLAKRKIRFDESIRVADMAHQLGIKSQEIIKSLFSLGVMATINQSLDIDTATLMASEFGYEIENVSFNEHEFFTSEEQDAPESLEARPPVVTIMGHVDHGKTSLLDAIRKTNITAGEAGGITQHIGAYHVRTDRGEIVFLDTPGHEAFTTMRMRGAQVTDIVILVVAADDGVMDQTREAISHAKAANVPIIVAINKMDKEDANPERVMRELSEFGLVSEAWGGETIFAEVSAKQNEGLDALLELILLQAEVLELKANPSKSGVGHIVESRLDKGKGSVGTVLISDGTIKQGDCFVCGIFQGKVRAMFNDQGKKIKSAGPAIPIEIQGFDGTPSAGDEFIVVADEKAARRISQSRQIKQREKVLVGNNKVTLESFLASNPDTDIQVQTLNLLIKADVHGSLEAVSEALMKLATDEIKIKIVHGGAGGITESDILLASASNAIIIGFNVRPDVRVKTIAEQEHVEIRFYDIIYKVTSEVKDAMSGLLKPTIEEEYLGQAEVREVFVVPKIGAVAGSFIIDGKLTRNAQVRLLREGVVVYTGTLASLRRFKDDVKEVAKGYECGIGLERFNDIKVGDSIEGFTTKEVARTID